MSQAELISYLSTLNEVNFQRLLGFKGNFSYQMDPSVPEDIVFLRE